MTPIVAITGPTAVGKSSLADMLAMRWGSEVLSADAMQVYRGMDIGTAKTPADERPVPLRLVDLVDVFQPYSAAQFQVDARGEVERLQSEGKTPIFCGGTGLYLRAALDDMHFPKGEVDDERRERYNKLAEDLGPLGIHAMLEKRDPRSAEIIHPNNVKRVVRALEMCDEGVSYADQAAGFSQHNPFYEHVTFALTMDRARLYKRIDRRVDVMMGEGLLEEVKGLLDCGARDALTSMQAIGYKELISYLDGECTLSDAVDLIKQRSRRYAKRQISWCKRDERTRWIDLDRMGVEDALDLIEHEVLKG